MTDTSKWRQSGSEWGTQDSRLMKQIDSLKEERNAALERIKVLEKAHEMVERDSCLNAEECNRLSKILQARENKITSLEEALKPFADFVAVSASEPYPDHMPIPISMPFAGMAIMLSDFRRARKARGE